MSKLVKNIRLQNYNYQSSGFYFITNNTFFSKNLLDGGIKEIVRNVLFELPKKFAGVGVYYHSIMPTHIHCILSLQDAQVTVPEVWRVFKSKTTVFARKNGLTEKHLWQPNYFEHIIRNERSLEKIVKYIHDNPFKENIPFDEIYDDRIPK
ncbi:hypothetical protein C4565_01305 [Candidatus Parcubacteria bacterium]|nr:MAG: hypothetical protein C4565_01305 [Candidatus Parcubacteria bacterium]